jgi:hypothetical protein
MQTKVEAFARAALCSAAREGVAQGEGQILQRFIAAPTGHQLKRPITAGSGAPAGLLS